MKCSKSKPRRWRWPWCGRSRGGPRDLPPQTTCAAAEPTHRLLCQLIGSARAARAGRVSWSRCFPMTLMLAGCRHRHCVVLVRLPRRRIVHGLIFDEGQRVCALSMVVSYHDRLYLSTVGVAMCSGSRARLSTAIGECVRPRVLRLDRLSGSVATTHPLGLAPEALYELQWHGSTASASSGALQPTTLRIDAPSGPSTAVCRRRASLRARARSESGRS